MLAPPFFGFGRFDMDKAVVADLFITNGRATDGDKIIQGSVALITVCKSQPGTFGKRAICRFPKVPGALSARRSVPPF